ncbi:acylphosphatase [Candidatus Micrarchaeota archaeon]|nr:acylphosphatase [Candidatus Micrarchaeota archaeon]
MDNLYSITFEVTGKKIQKAGFRSAIEDIAVDLEITGYAKNKSREDSSGLTKYYVEVAAEGTKENLKEFIRRVSEINTFHVVNPLDAGSLLGRAKKNESGRREHKEFIIDRGGDRVGERMDEAAYYMKSLSKDMKGMNGTMGEMSGDMKGMSEDMKGLRGTMGEMSGDMKGMSEDMKGLRGTMGEMSADMKGMNGTMQGMSGEMRGMSKDMKNMNSTMGGMSKELKGVSSDIKGMSKNTQNLGEEMSKMREETHQNFQTMDSKYHNISNKLNLFVDIVAEYVKSEKRELSDTVDGLKEKYKN